VEQSTPPKRGERKISKTISSGCIGPIQGAREIQYEEDDFLLAMEKNMPFSNRGGEGEAIWRQGGLAKKEK